MTNFSPDLGKMPRDSSDTVAMWIVPLQDKVYKVEFQHGTTTGKRVILIDDKVLQFINSFKREKKHFSRLGTSFSLCYANV